MPHQSRDAALVRGADGILYEVSDRAAAPMSAMSIDEPAADAQSIDGRAVGLSDHAAARIQVDPGDHAAARIQIDPGDHAAARIQVDPGDLAASPTPIDPANG